MKELDIDKLIIICGVGRSGTSLLQSMLNAHPDICFPPETHFFREYVSDKKKRKQLEGQGAVIFSNILNDDIYFERLGFDVNYFLAPYITGKSPFDLLSAYRRLLSIYAQSGNAHRLGDKDPRIIDYLPHLKSSFPHSRVIHLIRDPRDVLVSRMKAAWSRNKPDWIHALIYQAQMLAGRKLGKKLFGNQYLEIKYEDLIKEPEVILLTICKHLGIIYNQSMLDFGKSASRLIAQNEMQWKKETLGPLLNDNMGKWRKELTPWQISITEAICETAFKDLGYIKYGNKKKLSQSKKIMLVFMPAISALFNFIYKFRTI